MKEGYRDPEMFLFFLLIYSAVIGSIDTSVRHRSHGSVEREETATTNA